MQARIVSFIAAAAILAAASTAFAQSQSVQTPPAEAGFDMFLEIDGIKGESRDPPLPPPPPPPPPANAAPATPGQNVTNGEASRAALLVPAVQRIREARAQSAPTAPRDVTGGGQGLMPELPICGHCGADVVRPPEAAEAAALTDGLLILRANEDQASAAPRDVTAEAQGMVPEQPVCGHCGADILTRPAAAEAPAEEPRGRRGGFSLTIGGVTVGSGGVSVAVGGVDGDSGQSAGRQHRPVRPVRESGSR